MNKKRTNTDLPALLMRELLALRKGSGLTPWKLQSAVELRKVIAKKLDTDAATVSAEQVFAYLLYELSELGTSDMANALRSAYAIGQDAPAYSLTDRRTNFALQIQRHPDTVKAYEDLAIKQLAYQLVTNPIHEIQALTGVQITESSSEYNRTTKALERSITEGLAGLYELGNHGSEILKVFGKHKKPYLEMNVECTLLPSNRGSEWYTYKYRYTFHFSKTTFRVGIVTSPQDSGILMKSGIVDETTQLCADADFNQEMADIINSWRFIAHHTQTGVQLPFWFTEVEPTRRRELLSTVWQIDPDNCRIIEVALPSEVSSQDMLYEVYAQTELRVSERYAYWEAPGLIYLNNVVVDVSKFPNRDKWEFLIKPFLGTSFPGTLETTGDRFTLPASSWVMLGHGIAIIWQEAKPRVTP